MVRGRRDSRDDHERRHDVEDGDADDDDDCNEGNRGRREGLAEEVGVLVVTVLMGRVGVPRVVSVRAGVDAEEVDGTAIGGRYEQAEGS